MQTVEKKEDLLKLHSNFVCGSFPTMLNSKIMFRGENNILFCEDDIVLDNSTIEFAASNSIIFLRKSNHKYRVSFKVFNNSTLYIDSNNYFNETLNIVLSEETNFIVGKDNMFSTGISIMTSDHHLIYDIDSLERLNYSKSIYIGDHVWIGQNVTILKNTKIDSGSIIGASSVVPGIEIKNNSIYAGNPAKMIKNRTFWNGAAVHKWTSTETEKNRKYNNFISDTKLNTYDFIYEYDEDNRITFESIEEYLRNNIVENRLTYLLELAKNTNKNRFVHFKEKELENNKIKILKY